MTTESLLVSAQSHHLVELSDATDNHCELAAFFCFPRSALQASDLLEQQIALVDLFSTEGGVAPGAGDGRRNLAAPNRQGW